MNVLFIGSLRAWPADTTQVSTQEPSKSTTTAILLSAVFPGAGQLYTEQYWKIPIFTGTCAVSAWLIASNQSQFSSASAAYDAAVARGATAVELRQLRGERETYRSNRDVAGLVFVAAYLLAAVDAYVGAELYAFDVSPNLAMGIGPTTSQMMALQLRLQW